MTKYYTNAREIWARFRTRKAGGMGCVCGWQCCARQRWWDTEWEEHLQVCSLVRDEEGNVINLDRLL